MILYKNILTILYTCHNKECNLPSQNSVICIKTIISTEFGNKLVFMSETSV